MDLTQAEAVMDVISAGSDLALKAAQTQLDGGVGAQVDELKDNLVHVLAHIEAYIDFPDEDISPGHRLRSVGAPPEHGGKAFLPP